MLTIDRIWQADTQQAHFRLLLDAMSYPGKCLSLKILPEKSLVALTILSTLLDAEVSLADPHNLLNKEDWQMLQAKSEGSDQADFILCDASQAPDFTPKLGTLNCPEQSTTFVLVVDKLGEGDHKLNLTGAGIKENKTLLVKGLNSKWLSTRNEWCSSFPLGVDLILIDDQNISALPRTTKVEVI